MITHMRILHEAAEEGVLPSLSCMLMRTDTTYFIADAVHLTPAQETVIKLLPA